MRECLVSAGYHYRSNCSALAMLESPAMFCVWPSTSTKSWRLADQEPFVWDERRVVAKPNLLGATAALSHFPTEKS